MKNSHKKFDVVVVGEINADLILKGNIVPAFGQIEQIVEEADLVMGSSAVIFACGIARLGLNTAFIGKVGDDLFGRFMVEAMRKREIETSGITIEPKIKTGFSVILSKKNDRAILTFPGSIPELRYDEIDFNLIENCRHLHLSSFYLLKKLQPRIPELLRKSKKMGLSISLDTNYDPEENWDGGLQEAFSYIDIFLPNETEAKAITKSQNVEDAMLKLSNNISVVVIKLGEKGAIAKWKDDSIIVCDAKTVKVMDTVGAGDSFDAGFIFGYLNEWTQKKNLKMAVACGTLSTLQLGGTSGQANLFEAMNFMGQNI